MHAPLRYVTWSSPVSAGIIDTSVKVAVPLKIPTAPKWSFNAPPFLGWSRGSIGGRVRIIAVAGQQSTKLFCPKFRRSCMSLSQGVANLVKPKRVHEKDTNEGQTSRIADCEIYSSDLCWRRGMRRAPLKTCKRHWCCRYSTTFLFHRCRCAPIPQDGGFCCMFIAMRNQPYEKRSESEGGSHHQSRN